jgi:hypothetical protein
MVAPFIMCTPIMWRGEPKTKKLYEKCTVQVFKARTC